MANTYHPQSDHRPTTLTVGELIAHLGGLDPAAPVIFRSPEFGCYGPGQCYTIDSAQAEHLTRKETHYPSVPSINEETGEAYMTAPYTDVHLEWSGVVLG